MVRDPRASSACRVKVPALLPRLVPLDTRYLPAEQLLLAHLGSLFAGMIIDEAAVFRVTRNADLTVEEEKPTTCSKRSRWSCAAGASNAVRLEIADTASGAMLDLLVREPSCTPRRVPLLDADRLRAVLGAPAPRSPRPQGSAVDTDHAGAHRHRLEAERSIFSVMLDRAILVHHPYESFATSIEAFIAQAANDRSVQTIKMTLYRAGGDSPIIRSLMRAAERGVQVAVLVELKARFDEANNVSWARQLERVGVHVIYGMAGLKTHSKCVLVVRDDGDQLRRYCHIGTGNYNSKTARLYEDLGFLTADPDTGADVARLFNHLTGYSRGERYHTLVVAPRNLRARILELIDNEIAHGADGRITLKANSIADAQVIDALYRASAAGVRVDMVIRGICCLRAGVPGLSDNIRVRSVLGRYLEHSRIYRFDHGGADGGPAHLIGSADMMPRNLDRRVEVLVPIEHPKHREWLDTTLGMLLADDIVRWELRPDDEWERCGPTGEFAPHPQERMYQWVLDRQVPNRSALKPAR